MMLRLPALVLCAALAVPPITVAAAQTDSPAPPSRADIRRACAPDYQRFCRNLQPGSGELRQCFAAHFGELTPACADVLRKLSAAAPQANPG